MDSAAPLGQASTAAPGQVSPTPEQSLIDRPNADGAIDSLKKQENRTTASGRTLLGSEGGANSSTPASLPESVSTLASPGTGAQTAIPDLWATPVIPNGGVGQAASPESAFESIQQSLATPSLSQAVVVPPAGSTAPASALYSVRPGDLDYGLPDGDGLTLVQDVREAGIKIPLIVLTGQGDEQIAVELMKAGASDYITKGKMSSESLSRSLYNALRIYRAESQAFHASQKLKESEERYRLVLEGVNDGIWDWDLSKNEVYWNDRLLEIIGLSRDRFGSTMDALYNRLHPEDKDGIIRAIGAHLEQEIDYNVEFRLLHSSGAYRYCTSQGKAQRNSQGKALRMAGMISDITDRKQAEDALEKERQQLKQIITCVPVAMAMFGSQG